MAGMSSHQSRANGYSSSVSVVREEEGNGEEARLRVWGAMCPYVGGQSGDRSTSSGNRIERSRHNTYFFGGARGIDDDAATWAGEDRSCEAFLWRWFFGDRPTPRLLHHVLPS